MMSLLLRSTASIIFLGMLLISLALIVPMDQLHADDRFERLYSESSGADQNGNATFWEIESTVHEVKKQEKEIIEGFDEDIFLTGIKLDRSDKRPLFVYNYEFKNKGSNSIRLNLSDGSVIQSPLTDLAQDFAIRVGPQEKVHISFLSDSLPREQSSPVNVGIWDSSSNSWDFIGSGLARVFVPSEHALINISFAQIRTDGKYN